MSDGKAKRWVIFSSFLIYAALLAVVSVENRLTLWCKNSGNAHYRVDSYNQAYGDQIQAETCASISGVIDIFAGNVDRRPPNESSERAENNQAEQDLRAQRIMARWTFVIAVASIVSIVVMAIGTALVYATLMESRRLTGEAIKTTRVSDKMADAAIEANRQSREAMIMQNRPWLLLKSLEVISDLEWIGDECELGFRFVLENLGKTPARYVNIWPHAFVLERAWSPADIFRFLSKNPPHRAMSGDTVAQGSAFEQTVYVNFAKENLVHPDDGTLLLIARATYSTLFDDDARSSTFVRSIKRKVRINGKVLDDETAVVTTREGFVSSSELVLEPWPFGDRGDGHIT